MLLGMTMVVIQGQLVIRIPSNLLNEKNSFMGGGKPRIRGKGYA